MRIIARLTLMTIAGLSVAGCGGSRPAAVATASCDRRPGIALAQHSAAAGIYRAGALTLAAGSDLAQVAPGTDARSGGGEAVVLITGRRPVTVRAALGSPVRVGWQFEAGTPGHPVAVPAGGRSALRFPACGSGAEQFHGGLTVRGKGCARVAVDSGHQTAMLLLPVGNSLSGCPQSERRRLPSASLPFLGVACGRPNWIGCGRIGVGVSTETPARLVVVEIAGRLVALSAPVPPQTPTVWQGYLLGAGFRHGPLRIPVGPHESFWYGSPEVYPYVRVTAFFAGERVASTTGRVLLHPGFG